MRALSWVQPCHHQAPSNVTSLASPATLDAILTCVTNQQVSALLPVKFLNVTVETWRRSNMPDSGVPAGMGCGGLANPRCKNCFDRQTELPAKQTSRQWNHATFERAPTSRFNAMKLEKWSAVCIAAVIAISVPMFLTATRAETDSRVGATLAAVPSQPSASDGGQKSPRKRDTAFEKVCPSGSGESQQSTPSASRQSSARAESWQKSAMEYKEDVIVFFVWFR